MSKSILEQIHKLNLPDRQSIMTRRQTRNQINKLIGAAMYRRNEKVGQSDIIAHAVDYLYHSVMEELGKVEL